MLRILAALCRQSGGELRVSGAEVDRVGEPTALTKEWDAATQQVVLRVESISFREVYRLTPENQTPKPRPEQLANPTVLREMPTSRPNGPTEEFTPSGTTLDDSRLSELERKRNLAHAAATIRRELNERQRQRERDQQ